MELQSRHRGAGLWGLVHLSSVLLWLALFARPSTSNDTPFLPQSFMFDWTPEGQTPPVPTTAQCETLHISWKRGSATGPNPVAPYFLHVFTSAFVVPFVIPAGSDTTFDWHVPFVPGTQYQICMFDSANNTGGCQDIYTVYPALNSSITGPPICTNLSYPHPDQVLDVNVSTSIGGFSLYGWINECTDISVHPINGTPPYTLTIAPTLRPPYIITSQTNDPMNWTVSLSWGSSFFISVTDSMGNLWSAGPLHSGAGTNGTACLDESGTFKPAKNRTWITAIASSCSALLGVLLGLLVPLLFARCRMRRVKPKPQRKRSDTTTSRTGLVSPFDERATVSSVHAEQGTSTELADSPTGWPETPNSRRTAKKSGDLRRTPTTTTDPPSSPAPMSTEAAPPTPARDAPDDSLDSPTAITLDLPPRYGSPFDARFRLAPAPPGASRLRPLPTPPTPPTSAHLHEE